MQIKYRYYFDFTSDLNRVIRCLIDKDLSAASIFLHHAQKIYDEKLLRDKENAIFDRTLESLWNELLTYDINDTKERGKFADKLVTFTSIIFENTYTHAFN